MQYVRLPAMLPKLLNLTQLSWQQSTGLQTCCFWTFGQLWPNIKTSLDSDLGIDRHYFQVNISGDVNWIQCKLAEESRIWLDFVKENARLLPSKWKWFHQTLEGSKNSRHTKLFLLDFFWPHCQSLTWKSAIKRSFAFTQRQSLKEV